MRFAIAAALAASAVAQIPPYNIVQRLQLIPDASTLVTAVVAGGLVNALSGPSVLTVFAPDNFAFDRLPPGVLSKLLANVTLLDEVLTYHVVKGNVSSSQLTNGEKVPTLNGANILVNIVKGPNGETEVILDQDSRVTYANNYATNGVIHFIDRVLIPRAAMSAELKAVFDAAEEEALVVPVAAPPTLNLVQRLQLIPQFSTLVTAVIAAGDVATLSGKGPFSLLAPNDFAFARLPPGALERLIANKTELQAVLLNHVISGEVLSKELKDGEEIPMVGGGNVSVQIYTDKRPTPPVTIIEFDHHARVLNADNLATNGVFHEIDEVLFPRA